MWVKGNNLGFEGIAEIEPRLKDLKEDVVKRIGEIPNNWAARNKA